ncbi:gliding motility-associated C-terminal domain-containing protein [Flavobacterium bizetiae]|uniref:DUF7507 domain-containing protein n=1 Tax=Flavobacterium bizetiae TaxID=2704140 RepID=UPI0021E7F842|nr:gliding motility-associated C-terminal domain-containing protein [Flavobacterium bizetiae]UTN03199.1 gliding motility-associated C-terminal domain-containing protein [Flavobacterium bizetiae]
MKKKLLKKLLFLVLFLFLAFKANAQYATSHYIAPSPWQYWSDANEIVLTTESATAVTVTLKKSDGTFLATRTVTSAAPDVYRFVGQPWTLQNNPVNTIQDDRGLIVESTGGKVSVNLRNVASDQANGSGGDTNGGTIKGNASLVSFGNEGRGTSFRLGYYRTDFSGIQGFNGAAGRPVYAVMAIDDATQVKLNGTNLVLLNKGQSYLFQPTTTGALLESDKPVVANTGAYTDAPGGCGDGAVDQMAPISILGNRYIVVRGSGTAGEFTNLPEQSTIIATESGTTVTVDNYSPTGTFINTTTFTLAAGAYRSIHHGDATNRYSSSIIMSNKPIAVYSGTAQSCEVDIATVLPVGGCSGSKRTSTSEFKGYLQQVLPYFGFVLVESATAPVFVNGNDIETTTGINRFQLGTTGVYLIRFENTQIGNPPNITITSTARMNVGVVQQGGGFSMSGFFSSFNETPDLPQVTKDSNGCAINIITADPGLEPYQWYFDGALIPGAMGQSIVPLKTGNYSITGTRDCGVTGKSAAIYVAVCGDREVEKTVANGTLSDQVIFTVTAKNHGPNEDRNVTVTDALPSGYTFVSATPSTGTYNSSTGIWNIGNLAVNASATLNITATIIATGAVTNTATITGDNLDNTVANDSDTATPLAKLELVKTARTGVFNTAGDVITYDLVVTNAGKVPVRNIVITDANADSGSISPAIVAVLLPGASASFTATHTVTQADLIAEKVVNSAKADGVDGSNNPVSDTSGTDIYNDTPTETVTKSVIVADNDTVNNINGRTGKNNVINIFANDNINGTVVAPADVTITVKAPGVPTGLTLNANGNVDVAAGTAAGTYTFDYTICEVGIPLNCDDAKVTVVVTTINADNDTPDPINGTTGGTIPTVFGNDTLDGAAFLPADVTLTTSTTLPTGLTLNSDGTITVAANTAPGTHVINYTICQKANPLICDDATTTVIVTTINADNDTPDPINGKTGGTIPTVFGNDTLDGVAFSPADVTLTTSTTLPTGLTLNSDGTITVAANTAPGTHVINYTICQKANPLICDDATTTVVVTTINADNDTPDPINGTTGGTIPTVFGNDTLDGAAFLPADVTLTTSTTLPTGLTLNSDGTITVDANTAPGTHVISYTICQKANPLICDDATTTVVVTTINADNDTPNPINGTTGGTIPTVFGNDTFDGAAFLPADVTLTTSTTLPTGLTLNSDGTITVAANTAPGTHVISYTICQKANPLICDDATTTVIVTTINADSDTPDPINGTTGGTIPTVFGNDTLDGATFLPADVTLTTPTTLPTGLTLNSDGTITVAANTAPGTHVINYTICQKANPLICDDATTTVIVTTINADSDTPDPINGTTGGTIPTVFGNDTLDGATFLPADVTVTTSTTLPTGLTLNSDGTITVAANTAPGTHVINYTICQKANPLICDDATTTVIVTTINADNDTPDPINGTTGGTIPTVFGNDTLDGAAFLPADVTLTTSTTLPTGLTLNSDGTITVAANTAPGTHVINYTICQKANPLICDDATTTVIVTTINADSDTPDPINGTTGGTIPTVFGNDTLDGAAFLPADVTLTTSTTLPTGLTLNSDGTITVAANTAPGTHVINYTICQKANPLICDDATTTVIVTTINADSDTPDPINGTTGGTIPTVFGNDTLDGAAFLPADVTLTTSTTLPTGLTLNSDGTITVAANTAPGTHVINYTICQKANPLICDDATTTVIVTTINADNDTPDPINGTTGGTIPTVFGNDTLDGAAFLPADVTLTTSTTLPTGLTLNPDGTITVAANTAPGTHVINYTICQKANPLICDDATTTVIVTTINADNDTPDPINGTTGGTIPTVFGNDTLDGAAFLPADVTLTTSTTLPTGLTLNPDGTITVAANTAPGTHVINYTICQKANPLICDDATIEVVVQVPSVEVIKKGTFNDANGDGFAQKGETITYNFSVVNTGTMQLTNVVVTDPMVTVAGGPIAVLNVGAKDDTTFSATYTITQANVDAGFINNQALVTASPIVGTPISNLSDSNDPALPGKNDPTITKLSQNPGLKLFKQGIFEDANHDGSVSEGDRINYVFRVINTGNVTIKDIVVSDPMVTVSGGPISLEPQAFDATTFKASYVLTQSDIDLGAVYNLALVTGNDPNGVSIDNDSEDVAPLTPKDKFYEPACPTCTVTTLEQKSGIALIKTAVFNDENNNGNAEAGETITYRFVVTNTGNVRLSNITITDPLPGIVMTGGPISLAPGESDSATFKGTYALKQSDINSGKVSNQAFVTGQNPLGVIVNDASDDNDNSGNNPTVLAIQGCVIKIFNAMSPNGDAKNERFYIQGLECYPDNRVEIYNRWGVLVFERENYNNEERAFRGISEGRTTVKQSDGLPVGTYYYILKYKDSDSNAHQEAGYLYLSK